MRARESAESEIHTETEGRKKYRERQGRGERDGWGEWTAQKEVRGQAFRPRQRHQEDGAKMLNVVVSGWGDAGSVQMLTRRFVCTWKPQSPHLEYTDKRATKLTHCVTPAARYLRMICLVNTGHAQHKSPNGHVDCSTLLFADACFRITLSVVCT